MPVITLPDGAQKNFDQAVSVLEIAQSISPSLAKNTIAGLVNNVLVDASFKINTDSTLSIVRAQDEKGLEVLRHSTAHLLAQAVKQLYPSAQVTIGPVIEDGFFYDFAFKDSFSFGPEDLIKIEKKMGELVKQQIPVVRSELSRDQAIKFFEDLGESYKAEIIRDIPEGETLSLYTQGDFTDLCRGPHVPNTGFLKTFKLLKLAGAYWRGDSKNQMLQRIYGTAWGSISDQEAYLKRLEEAAKRDHRIIGKQLGLFHLQEEAPGMVFWHDHGWHIFRTMEADIRTRQQKSGYQEIRTPQVLDFSLWKASGHADKFIEQMFVTESEKRNYALKPMSCPCHIQVFNQGIKSYRDLPLRLAEFGCCHRNEPSGALHGIMRVRGFTQDDGHIFCTKEQIKSEVEKFMKLAFEVYDFYGFKNIEIKLATRPEKRLGEDSTWDYTESALAEAIKSCGYEFDYLPGEGAFYGPKVELHLKDSLGRKWQCGTIQLDPLLPERLGAEYIDEHGQKQTPFMLHRAVLGSFERFIGMYIEHCAGWFPSWLAPVQVIIMGVTSKHDEYCKKVKEELESLGFRAKFDLRNEKVGYKIREHILGRIPYIIVVGDQEVSDNSISVRTREGEDLGSLSILKFSQILNSAIAKGGRLVERINQEKV